jgi:hypothetical protein
LKGGLKKGKEILEQKILEHLEKPGMDIFKRKELFEKVKNRLDSTIAKKLESNIKKTESAMAKDANKQMVEKANIEKPQQSGLGTEQILSLLRTGKPQILQNILDKNPSLDLDKRVQSMTPEEKRNLQKN